MRSSVRSSCSLVADRRSDLSSASLPNNDSRVSEMGQDDALAQLSLHTEQRCGAERGIGYFAVT